MGGINSKGHTAIFRVEYDKATNSIVERARNSSYEDFSSMSTSMSMFDFNNDGKQEVVYRDEVALYILNGETLKYDDANKISDCFSGTGWEYPVVVSLTPSGESSIIMSSGSTSQATRGTLRIYGADSMNGNRPWMPARRVWNQYSYYQNTIQDDLTIISKPAALNEVIKSKDGAKTMQPFNGHMFQLGIIKPSSLESVYPLADLEIDLGKTGYGFDRIGNRLKIDFEVNNIGDAPMDPNINIELLKYVNGASEIIYTDSITKTFYTGDNHPVTISVDNFQQYYPFDSLKVYVARTKYDCNPINNQFKILPEQISGVLYVKKGDTGKGLSWQDALGELREALTKAKNYNKQYPNSLTQVWVAGGIYEGNFVMQEGLNVYGGFKGFEDNIEDSRPFVFPTIIDGQKADRVLSQNEDFVRPTTWRGFFIQNGKTEENGGGVYLKKGSTLSHSILRFNTSTEGVGGGVYTTGGRVVNCVIELNSASLGGGGIYANNASVVINNTVVKNTSMTNTGGGIYSNISSVINNIVYGNAVATQIDNLYAIGGVVNNNLADNEDSQNPLFLDFGRGDYKLMPISPALNMGDNSVIDYKSDLAGKARIYDANRVDLGAYEYQGKQMTLSKEGYFYVNNSKDGNGATWESATKELSDALIAAKIINDNKPNTVKRIWVAAGTYKGTYEMVEGANVHGGFVGNETDFNQIDTVANKTYLDAQQLGRVLTQTKDFQTPTEWAGLIFQNGQVRSIDRDAYGGGAYLKKNGAIRYSTIRNNTAIAIGANNKVNAYGGGVYMEKGASLDNTILDNNDAVVDLLEGSNVAYGVAQGGGVNNMSNRLSYLVVRNNMTSSKGNRDGGGVYSTGSVVNSIVNNNTGQSAIYIGTAQTIINNTIVDNVVDYTIVGDGQSKIQNNIIYGNQPKLGDFEQVHYEGLNNLVAIDPIFETGGYKPSLSSPAQAIGNVNYFPADLNVDMEGNSRFISLKNNVRVIDAGAYQSKLKVKLAEATRIEVPFGTKFESLQLAQVIEGKTVGDFAFDCNVDWSAGRYNELLPGDYMLSGDLIDLPNGIVNPDNIQGTITVTVKKNHISDLVELSVGGEDWLSKLETPYTVDCSNSQSDNLPIKLLLPHFATVSFEPEVQFEQDGNHVSLSVDVLRPGYHALTATVTSQDEKSVTTYPITIVKYFPFWDIIEQRWNNTFVINNNKSANGGYEFVSYKWFKNDLEIGAKQYYSAGDRRTDLLDERALYHAEMVDKNGVKYTTCKEKPVLMNSAIKVYPNPVKMGEAITIELPQDNNREATIDMYSLGGLSVKHIKLNTNISTVEAPTTPGMYILQVSIAGGASESIRMIVH